MNQDLLRRADACFTSWQRGLVFETKVHGKRDDAASEVKGPIRQRQTKLIEAVSDGPVPLGRYLRTVLGLTGDEQIAALPFPRKALTPNEFREPPVELEQELGEAWKSTLGFRPALASSPLYWLLCHVVWIEEGRLGDSGVPLEQALLSGSDAREAQIRNFLRRTGGLPHIRGKHFRLLGLPIRQGLVALPFGRRSGRDHRWKNLQRGGHTGCFTAMGRAGKLW